MADENSPSDEMAELSAELSADGGSGDFEEEIVETPSELELPPLDSSSSDDFNIQTDEPSSALFDPAENDDSRSGQFEFEVNHEEDQSLLQALEPASDFGDGEIQSLASLDVSQMESPLGSDELSGLLEGGGYSQSIDLSQITDQKKAAPANPEQSDTLQPEEVIRDEPSGPLNPSEVLESSGLEHTADFSQFELPEESTNATSELPSTDYAEPTFSSLSDEDLTRSEPSFGTHSSVIDEPSSQYSENLEEAADHSFDMSDFDESSFEIPDDLSSLSDFEAPSGIDNTSSLEDLGNDSTEPAFHSPASPSSHEESVAETLSHPPVGHDDTDREPTLTQVPPPEPMAADPEPTLAFGKGEMPSQSPGSSESMAPEPILTSSESPEKMSSGIDQIAKFAQSTSVGEPQIDAADPYHLYIDGHLDDVDQARLVDILNQEKMGIREVDLEQQFELGKVLIPRISEYAGILIIQSLRDASVRFRLAPSEQADQAQNLMKGAKIRESWIMDPQEIKQVAPIPVVSGNYIPDLPAHQVRVGDLVHSSALIDQAEAHRTGSHAYQEITETLKRAIVRKAQIRGACGIIQFKVQLLALTNSDQYRMNAQGTLIYKKETDAAHASLKTSFPPEPTL